MASMHSLRLLATSVLVICSVETAFCGDEEAQWIWTPIQTQFEVPTGACYFRRVFETDTPTAGTIEIAADDRYEVFVNGFEAARGEQWQSFRTIDVASHLVKGKNAIAIKVVNTTGNTAGMVARVVVHGEDGHELQIVSDESWESSLSPRTGWKRIVFADVNWIAAESIGAYGKAKPWRFDVPVTANKLAAATSTTKPRRYELELEPTIELMAGEEEIVEPSLKRRAKPLLLKPIEQAFPWLKKNLDDSSTDTEGAASKPAMRIFPRRQPEQLGEPGNERGVPKQASPQEIIMPKVSSTPAATVNDNDSTSTANNATTSKAQQSDPVNPQAHSVDTQFTPTKGFEVEHVLGHQKTGSLISATFNEFGQLIAGQEDGPLVLCVDTDDDHSPDEVRTYCDKVKNCQGLLALSGMVFAVGDGPEGSGLYRLTDQDRDGTLEEVTALALFDVSVKEHGPHGIVLGPDSNLYVVVGNHAKLQGQFSKSSPRNHLYEGDLIPRYEDPGGHASGVRLPAGFILRTDINGQNKELFASGLRNPYDLAFNADGQLFTYDSDMESDQGTNWYRPTRLYHVLPGSEFGWRSGWAKWPAYYQDVVPPIAETGRGSPTGIVFYHHNVYPSAYQNVAFMGDWSRGRILVARLDEDGATYAAKTEVFLEGTPLNVTDLDVGPDGTLYFVTGGRGTQGGVFRVVWKGGKNPQPQERGISQAIHAPQINGSWGRQKVAAIQQSLGNAWSASITASVRDTTLSSQSRVQALQLMQWLGPIPQAELLFAVSRDADVGIRRMGTYLMSGQRDSQVPLRLLELLDDPDPTMRRLACESLVRARKSVPFEYLEPLLASNDRAETWAARLLLAQDEPDEWQAAVLESDDIRVFIQGSTTLMAVAPTKERAIAIVTRSQQIMNSYVSDNDFVDLLRIIQLAIVRGELKASDVPDMTETLAEEFPANHQVMNRELIRLLVRLNVTSIMDRYLDHLDSGISDEERIHLATHLRFLEAEHTTEQKMRLFKHLRAPVNAGNSVAGYLQSIAKDLGKDLKPGEDVTALDNGSDYPSAALAAVLRMPESLSLEQIRKLVSLDKTITASDDVTKRLKVAILAVLARDGQTTSMAYLRDVYDKEPQRRLEVTIGLAEQPDGDNWIYLVRSLPLLDGPVAKEMLIKLLDVEQSPSDAEPYRQVIITGQRLGDEGGDDAVRLLEHWRGFASTSDTPPWEKAMLAWQNWFKKTFPDEAVPQLEMTTLGSKWDYDALLRHLQSDAVDEASIARGQATFAKADCVKCHRHGATGESMGPDLSTVGKRFLTKEIVDSIVYPSKVISDQYKAKTIATSDGKTITGIVGSGGPDELVVLQADATKIRVARKDVEQTIPSTISAMPEGLLNALTLDEITDLIAYLKSQPSGQIMSAKP